MNDNEQYREFQFSWLLAALLVPVYFLMYWLFYFQMGTRPMSSGSMIFLTALFGFVYLLFYGMTTVVAYGKLTVTFGIGLIRNTISLHTIQSVSVVRNPWYYGWGIRIIPKGMLYNVSGFEAVEIRFTDRTKILRIGSRQPKLLAAAIMNNK